MFFNVILWEKGWVKSLRQTTKCRSKGTFSPDAVASIVRARSSRFSVSDSAGDVWLGLAMGVAMREAALGGVCTGLGLGVTSGVGIGDLGTTCGCAEMGKSWKQMTKTEIISGRWGKFDSHSRSIIYIWLVNRENKGKQNIFAFIILLCTYIAYSVIKTFNSTGNSVYKLKNKQYNNIVHKYKWYTYSASKRVQM